MLWNQKRLRNHGDEKKQDAEAAQRSLYQKIHPCRDEEHRACDRDSGFRRVEQRSRENLRSNELYSGRQRNYYSEYVEKHHAALGERHAEEAHSSVLIISCDGGKNTAAQLEIPMRSFKKGQQQNERAAH